MRAVIFDAGKVLLDFDYSVVRVALALRAEREVPDLFSSPLVHYIEGIHVGKISCTQLWCHFRDVYAYRGSFTEFEQDICYSFQPISRGLEVLDEMLDYDQVKVAILSDNHHLCTRWMAKVMPQVFHADVIVLSQEVGFVKPDPRIYRATLEQLAIAPQDCIFIDDRQNNIETARSLGIQTLHHQCWDETYRGLSHFLA